jgi:predicted dehydrogenase
MKTLIAGFGSIGRRHLNNLRALGETEFVLLRSNRSTLPDDEIKGLPVETDIESALAHKPQAVVIANPTALHLDVAIPAARAGCSILIEKPVSHNQDRVREFADALKTGGGRVLIGFQFRFHPGLRQVKTWLDAGEIGEPVSCRAHWGEYLPDWHPWEDYRKGYSARADLGGGVVHTLSHPLDYQRWFFGEVSSLYAETSTQGGLDLDVEDTAEINMSFKNGLLSSTHLDYVQRTPEHSLKIIGTQGTILWDNAAGIASCYNARTGQWLRSSLPEDFERNSLFLEEMTHFLEVARGNAEPVCTLADGLSALTLAEAVHRSAKEGKRVKIHAALEN